VYKDVRLNGSSVALVVLEDASREDLHISDLDVLYTVDFPYEDAHTYFGRILQVFSVTILKKRTSSCHSPSTGWIACSPFCGRRDFQLATTLVDYFAGGFPHDG
jgi:hypothetical protein